MTELLTPDDVAERLNVSTKDLHRFRSTQTGPACIKINRLTVRYLSDDLEEWLNESGFVGLE